MLVNQRGPDRTRIIPFPTERVRSMDLRGTETHRRAELFNARLSGHPRVYSRSASRRRYLGFAAGGRIADMYLEGDLESR